MNIKLKALGILVTLMAIPAAIGLSLNYASSVYGSETVLKGLIFAVCVTMLYFAYSMIVGILESREKYNQNLENLSKTIDKFNK